MKHMQIVLPGVGRRWRGEWEREKEENQSVSAYESQWLVEVSLINLLVALIFPPDAPGT